MEEKIKRLRSSIGVAAVLGASAFLGSFAGNYFSNQYSQRESEESVEDEEDFWNLDYEKPKVAGNGREKYTFENHQITYVSLTLVPGRYHFSEDSEINGLYLAVSNPLWYKDKNKGISFFDACPFWNDVTLEHLLGEAKPTLVDEEIEGLVERYGVITMIPTLSKWNNEFFLNYERRIFYGERCNVLTVFSPDDKRIVSYYDKGPDGVVNILRFITKGEDNHYRVKKTINLDDISPKFPEMVTLEDNSELQESISAEYRTALNIIKLEKRRLSEEIK